MHQQNVHIFAKIFHVSLSATVQNSDVEVRWGLVNIYAKQKHLGCKKSARPIRSNMQEGRRDQKL